MNDESKRNEITNKATFYCQKLSEIARSFSEESSEYQALVAASKALLFSMTHEAFEQYCDDFQGQELSIAQIEHLEHMGINVRGNDDRHEATD